MLAWWKAQIGYCVLADLSPALFTECRNKLAREGGGSGKPLGAATIKNYFVVAADILKRCTHEWVWLEQSPLRDGRVDLPKLPRGVVRFLDDDELARLTKACKESPNALLYPAYMLAISTGMRQSETMNLYWKEPENPPTESAWGIVNLADACIILHETKNGDRRRIPLAGQALKGTVDAIIDQVERKNYIALHWNFRERSYCLQSLIWQYGIEYWKNRALRLAACEYISQGYSFNMSGLLCCNLAGNYSLLIASKSRLF